MRALRLALSLGVLLAGLPFAAPASAAQCDSADLQALAQLTKTPYLVVVGVVPPNPSMGHLRLVVRVCDALTGEPVSQAQVSLVPISPDGRKGATIHALNRYRGLEEYSADLKVKEPGLWRYRVEIASDAGRASFEVPLQVRKPPWYGNASGLIFIVVGAALLAGVTHLYFSARRARLAQETRTQESR